MGALSTRILVPTDFSETAEGAWAFGERLATRFGAELDLLHVHVLLEEQYLEGDEQDELQRLLEAGEKRSEAALADRANQGPSRARHARVVRGISAAEAIVETCAELGCDLVVMGTHGRRGLKHLIVGSVAEEVVRTAPVPVLTVRLGAADELEPIGRILVPHDFSDASSAALDVAARWADALDAELTLLHVVEPLVYPDFYAVDMAPATSIERVVARSREALAKVARERLGEVATRTEVTVGHAAEAIVGAATRTTYQLVIIGTRGLSGLEHLLLGSVAENVLRRCELPLLTVRGD